MTTFLWRLFHPREYRRIVARLQRRSPQPGELSDERRAALRARIEADIDREEGR